MYQNGTIGVLETRRESDVGRPALTRAGSTPGSSSSAICRDIRREPRTNARPRRAGNRRASLERGRRRVGTRRADASAVPHARPVPCTSPVRPAGSRRRPGGAHPTRVSAILKFRKNSRTRRGGRAINSSYSNTSGGGASRRDAAASSQIRARALARY